ncbi:TPA: LysR substrate-binding domain-containing protein, partial [Pseudomonas aeruginosa]
RRNGQEAPIELRERMTMSDPEATCEVAAMGLGITLVCMQHAYAYLESGALVRVLPDWYVDAGNTSLYYAANKLLPAKTRVFVDFVVDYFRRQDLARRFSAFPTG